MERTYNDVVEQVKKLVHSNKDELLQTEFVIGVSRGGLIPAAVVATTLNKPLVAAYIDKQDNVYFDRGDWIKDKKVLIVDDIVRSGKTLDLIKNLPSIKDNAAEVKTLTAFALKSPGDKLPDYTNLVDEDVVFPWDINSLFE